MNKSKAYSHLKFRKSACRSHLKQSHNDGYLVEAVNIIFFKLFLMGLGR